jgi:RecB family exonuclease
MDSILKTRYDKYRSEGTFPPETKKLFEALSIKPFEDVTTLNLWRESLTALKVINEQEGYVLQGKIDDVMVATDGKLIPTDYKSSGNAPGVDKQKYYRDQLAAYGLMFKKHGYEVSDQAYLLHYFVKDKDDGSVEVKFDSHIDPVAINYDAIETKLKDMVKFLNSPYPGSNDECLNCAYYVGRAEVTTATVF